MRIAESLLRSARSHPSKPALLCRDQRISYADLLGTTRSYASVLRDQGIGPGDIVAICFENSPEFIYAYYAISWLGATVLPVNLILTPTEIEYMLRDCQARAVITRPEFWPKFAAAAGAGTLALRQALLTGPLPQGESSTELIDIRQAAAEATPLASDPALVSEHAPAVLIYTSGTTGNPKGVMLSHHNLMWNTQAVVKAVSALEGDIFLLLLPVFHITAQTVCMLTPILVGASIAVVPKMDRAEMGFALSELRPTVFVAVPSLYNLLAAVPAPPPDKNSVRLYVSGGAPLPIEVQNRFEAAYGRPIFGGYGLTEASPVVAWNLPGANKPGSVGRPLEGVSVKIAGNGMESLETGAIGEICVAGDLVMLGYYKRLSETAETVVDGWLRTGDMGYLDSEGYLWVVDRKKEMLIHSGINIYPREIEERLHTLPEIHEAAVVGADDGAHGDIPVAFVSRRDNSTLTEKAVKDFCIANLARYKVPRRVFILDQLPHTGSGKVNKVQLREEAKKRLAEARRQ